MRRIAILTVASATAVLLGLAPEAGAHGDRGPGRVHGTIWITDRQNDRIAVYDAASGALLATVPTELTPDPLAADEPNDVAVAGGRAFVTNEASGTVSVFDVASRTLLRRLDAGPKPHHAASDPSGRYVVYGVYGTNEIGIIDARTETIRRLPASTRTGTVFTHSASFSAGGGTVFAANEVRSGATQLAGTVSVIDAATGRIRCEVEVGVRPSEVVAARHGHVGFVSVRNEHAIKEIDLRNCRLTGRSVDVGEEVDTLDLAPDARRVTVGLRGPAPRPARVALVDLVSFATADIRYWTIPGGTLTGHQWTSPSRRFTYAAFEGTGPGVAIVDHRRGTVTVLPSIGTGRPHGMAFAASGGRAWPS